MGEMVPCRIVRGGTSKGVFFRSEALPQDPEVRDHTLLRIMGSPDPRQIDGLGGADPLTSKIAIIGPGKDHDADITYTFGAVGIDRGYVNYSANCGNLTAAAALFAVEEGYVRGKAPCTRVVIYNTNSRKKIIVDVPIDSDGQPARDGDFRNEGVPGTGAEFMIDFAHTTGSTLGALLPTGQPMDVLRVPALRKELEVSIVDIGKICCFFRAQDLNLRGSEGPEEMTPEILQRFWAVREAAAAMVGISLDKGHLPTPVSIAPAHDYTNFMTKQIVEAQRMTFCARRVVGPPPRLHKAFAGTGAVCASVAANVPGTIVAEAVNGDTTLCRIGHPTGIFTVRVQMGPGLKVERASFSRTARTLMIGTVPA